MKGIKQRTSGTVCNFHFKIFNLLCMLFYKTQTKTNQLHSVRQGIPFNSPSEPLLAVVEMAKIVGWTLAYLGKTLGLDNKRKAVI
jgi:hypothetical protein